MVLATEFNFAKMGYPVRNDVVNNVERIQDEPLYITETRAIKQRAQKVVGSVSKLKSQDLEVNQNMTSPENKQILNSIYSLYSKLKRSIEAGNMDSTNVKEVYEMIDLFEKHAYKFDTATANEFIDKIQLMTNVLKDKKYKELIINPSKPLNNYTSSIVNLLYYIKDILEIVTGNEYLSLRDKKLLIEQELLQQRKEKISETVIKDLEDAYERNVSLKEKRDIEEAARYILDHEVENEDLRDAEEKVRISKEKVLSEAQASETPLHAPLGTPGGPVIDPIEYINADDPEELKKLKEEYKRSKEQLMQIKKIMPSPEERTYAPPAASPDDVDSMASMITDEASRAIGETEETFGEEFKMREEDDTDEISELQTQLDELPEQIHELETRYSQNIIRIEDLRNGSDARDLNSIFLEYLSADTDEKIRNVIEIINSYTDFKKLREYINILNAQSSEVIVNNLYSSINSEYPGLMEEENRDAYLTAINTYKNEFITLLETRYEEINTAIEELNSQNIVLNRKIAKLGEDRVKIVNNIKILRSRKNELIKIEIINEIIARNRTTLPTTDEEYEELSKNKKFFNIVVAKNIDQLISWFETKYELKSILDKIEHFNRDQAYSLLLGVINEIGIEYRGAEGGKEFIILTYKNEMILYKSESSKTYSHVSDLTENSILKVIRNINPPGVNSKTLRNIYTINNLRNKLYGYIGNALIANKEKIEDKQIVANELEGLTVNILPVEELEGANPYADDVDEEPPRHPSDIEEKIEDDY